MFPDSTFEAPLLIVGVIFLATVVPAFFKLRSPSGWPTSLGWLYLVIVTGSCIIAFQKEKSASDQAETELRRFTSILETVDRQQRVIDSGDITMLISISCPETLSSCDDVTPDFIISKPTGGKLLIEGALERIETTRPQSRGLPSRVTTFIGQPFFHTNREGLLSIDDLENRSIKLLIYQIPDGFRVSSASMFVKGHHVRGTTSTERIGGRLRSAVTFRFECLYCGLDDSADD